VPDSYREAAVALGATRWQMVFRVLLPAAKNGLLAAVLLGVGRAVGETMGVLMATGHAVNIPFFHDDGRFNWGWMFESVRTLTATIAAELGKPARAAITTGALPDWHPPVEHHLRHQSDRRPGGQRHPPAEMKTASTIQALRGPGSP